MALRKIVDDQWTSAGVKSTLIIDMPAQPSAEVSHVQTDICGWGWRFSCSIGPESRTASPILLGPDSQAIPWRRVTIHFHPEAIKGASYGRIHFHLEVRHLVELDSEPIYDEFDLPDNSWRSEQPIIGAYMKRKDAAFPPTVAISVKFPANLGISLPAPRDARVDAALADTLHGEEITDVKFYSYTRVGPGYVSHPRPLFAKLALLEGRSGALDAYLSAVFAEGFKESKLVDLDRVTPVEEKFADYDYMSDSDLDADDEDEATRRSEYSLRARDSLPSPSRPGSPANTDDPVCRQMGRVIDLDADDEDEATQRLNSEYSLPPNRAHNLPLPHSRPDSPIYIDHPVARRMGRVIVVKGFAFRTWNAFLYYLYTNQIEFRKLGSSGRLGSASKTPKCSAKSMYKLAEAFGLEDLKALALSSLRSQLSSENVVHETFSTFTSLFAEIQDIEVDLLLKEIPELTRNGDLEVMLRSVCDGARPQCYDVLRKIVVGRANKTVR